MINELLLALGPSTLTQIHASPTSKTVKNIVHPRLSTHSLRKFWRYLNCKTVVCLVRIQMHGLYSLEKSFKIAVCLEKYLN